MACWKMQRERERERESSMMFPPRKHQNLFFTDCSKDFLEFVVFFPAINPSFFDPSGDLPACVSIPGEDIQGGPRGLPGPRPGGCPFPGLVD